MTDRENHERLLESLRWKEDMLVTNAFGERVWLRPLFDENSKKRIGITDCCEETFPCKWHAAISSSMQRSGNG